MHNISNLTTEPSKQSEQIYIKEIELADGDCSLPLSCIEKQHGSNAIIQDKIDKKTHYKELIKDVHLLNVENINSLDLMKKNCIR